MKYYRKGNPDKIKNLQETFPLVIIFFGRMNYRTQIDFWSSLGPSVGFALMCELGEMHSYPI